MKATFFERASLRQLQWLVWVFVCLIIFCSYLPLDGAAQAATFSLTNTLFYACIIYGNISWLFPRLYQNGNRYAYYGSVLLLIGVAGFARCTLSWYAYNRFFADVPEKFTIGLVLNSIFVGLFMYIMSLIFRIALAYFALKKQAEEILLQKSHAELNLLKSQVQPHFLFNTLNNIYYEAYKEAPRTALLIERLSGIMRYFVDESPKEYVSLASEIQFLENYMALEQIRIRYGVRIHFTKTYGPEWKVPPMLLMTFVENVFKHGIDKTSPLNIVDISVQEIKGYLHFQTKNRLPAHPVAASANGFGIKNLRSRLGMLYGSDFSISTQSEDGYFIAFLKFPLV
jgi:hypothetical protein